MRKAISLPTLGLVILTFTAAAPVFARADKTVRINVVGSPQNPSLRVVPRAKAICKSEKSDCPTEVEWVAQGRPLDSDQVIEIKRKSNTSKCFEKEPYQLTKSQPSVSSGTTTCDPGTAWFYDVVLKKGNSVQDRVDPAIIIDF